MSVGTKKWDSIVKVVTRKLMWRRTSEGLEATCHGGRRSRVTRGLAKRGRRGAEIAIEGVRLDERVAQGRHVRRRSHRCHASRVLEVRVEVRGSLSLRLAVYALLGAVGERTAGSAGPGTVCSSCCKDVVGSIEFTTRGRAVEELRA